MEHENNEDTTHSAGSQQKTIRTDREVTWEGAGWACAPLGTGVPNRATSTAGLCPIDWIGRSIHTYKASSTETIELRAITANVPMFASHLEVSGTRLVVTSHQGRVQKKTHQHHINTTQEAGRNTYTSSSKTRWEMFIFAHASRPIKWYQVSQSLGEVGGESA